MTTLPTHFLSCPPMPQGDFFTQLPRSYEGGDQRCFKQLFVCTKHNLGQPYMQHALGQHVVQQLQRAGMVPSSAPRCGITCANDPAKRGGSSQITLHVTFHKRPGKSRQLLNAPELVAECNSWEYRPAVSAVAFVAKCSEVRRQV